MVDRIPNGALTTRVVRTGFDDNALLEFLVPFSAFTTAARSRAATVITDFAAATSFRIVIACLWFQTTWHRATAIVIRGIGEVVASGRVCATGNFVFVADSISIRIVEAVPVAIQCGLWIEA